MPPGPGLAAALCTVDLSRVPGVELVDVLRAQSRQCAHEQARLWASLLEVGLAVPPDERPEGSSNAPAMRAADVAAWASSEVAAALTWTSRTADRELDLAQIVVRALPEVFAALWAGEIDRGRAVVFAGYLDPAHGITPEQVAAICARLVPVAPRLTTAQLRGRLWRAVLAIDPDWARRRYRRAIQARTVTAVLADDGTVTLTGSGLPAAEAAVACARVDRLAEAARRAGHPERVGQIAADVYLGLLDGRFHGLSEEQIIDALLREPRLAGAGDDGTVHDADLDGTGDSGVPATPASGGTALDGTGPGGAGPHGAAADGAARRVPPGPVDDGAVADRPEKPDVAGGTGSTSGPVRPNAPASAGVEIRVGLGTLLGLDERPGEIPGLGPVLPGVARDLVARQQQGAEWRFAVTGPDGSLLLAGVTRRRPRCTQRGLGRCSGGIVELQVSAAELDRFARVVADGVGGPNGSGSTTARTGAWAGVIADIATQFARRHALLAELDGRPAGRFPGAALARHIQVRDRNCSHPGCRRPARHCDLDHTHDHARGGATVRANLGPGCDRHHPLKHGLGWRLAQPGPGTFEWTSPLQQVYRTRGEPITPPLPEPRPRAPEPDDHGDRAWIDGPLLRLPHLPSPAEARPPPADGPPPF